MTHFASPSFWAAYRALPDEIQDVADKNFALLKENSRHPSLRLKKVVAFWSPASDGTIGHWLATGPKDSSGSGPGRTTRTTA